MGNASFEIIDLARESSMPAVYNNHPIAQVNDHEVRISIMTEAYAWHCHPDSMRAFWSWREASSLTSTTAQLNCAPAT